MHPATRLCVLLLAAGCASRPHPTGTPRLNNEDAAFSRALAYYARGLLVEAGGGVTNSRADFETAASLDPGSRRLTDAVVLKRLEEKRTADALDTLADFCRRHPRDFAAHRDLARLAEELDDHERAARYYEAAFRLHPDDPTLAYARVRALFAAQRDRDALAAMKDLARTNPTADSRTLPFFWAQHFLRRERAPERALPCVDLAGALATGETQRVGLRLLRADAEALAGRTNDAMRTYEEVLDRSPGQILAATGLARLQPGTAGMRAKARLQRQTTSHPDDAAAWLTLAALHLAAEDRTNAAPALASAYRALQTNKIAPAVEFFLLHGATLDELERDVEAADVFKEGLRLYPQTDALMNYLAYMWAVDNVHLGEAETWSRRSLEKRPDNAAYLDTLGWIMYRQKRVQDALSLLMRALRTMPDDATVLDHAGDVLAELARTPEAVAYWSRSFALDPQLPGVAEKLKTNGVDPAAIPRRPPARGAPGDGEE